MKGGAWQMLSVVPVRVPAYFSLSQTLWLLLIPGTQLQLVLLPQLLQLRASSLQFLLLLQKVMHEQKAARPSGSLMGRMQSQFSLMP